VLKYYPESQMYVTYTGRLDSLIPKSRRPKRVRQMKITPDIVTFIRTLREEHPRIGKEKIKKFLDEYYSKKRYKDILSINHW